MAAGAGAAALALSGPAAAQSCQAPPGTAGIEQYCEAIPGPGHTQGRGEDGSGPNATAGRPVPGSARRALERAGKDGAALLDLTGKSPVKPGTTRKGTAHGQAGGTAPKGVGDDPFSAVKSAVKSGTSAGPGFVWALVVIGLLMGGMGWMVYRRRGSDAQP